MTDPYEGILDGRKPRNNVQPKRRTQVTEVKPKKVEDLPPAGQQAANDYYNSPYGPGAGSVWVDQAVPGWSFTKPGGPDIGAEWVNTTTGTVWVYTKDGWRDKATTEVGSPTYTGTYDAGNGQVFDVIVDSEYPKNSIGFTTATGGSGTFTTDYKFSFDDLKKQSKAVTAAPIPKKVQIEYLLKKAYQIEIEAGPNPTKAQVAAIKDILKMVDKLEIERFKEEEIQKYIAESKWNPKK